MRHRPSEPRLQKVLPWLAVERADLFNAHQQTQSPRAEKAMLRAKYVASFIGHNAGQALFIGLYKIGDHWPHDRNQYRNLPQYQELQGLGHQGFVECDRDEVLWFELEQQEFYSDWLGRLVVK